MKKEKSLEERMNVNWLQTALPIFAVCSKTNERIWEINHPDTKKIETLLS